MTLTSRAASDLLNSMEHYSFPMPPEAFVPAVWYLGAHMLNCILRINHTGKRVSKNKAERKRSTSRAERNARATPTALKGHKRTSPPYKGRLSESRLTRDVKTNSKSKERVHSGSKKASSKTGRHTGYSADEPRAVEHKRSRGIVAASEFAKRGPSLRRSNDSPKKQRRSSTSSTLKYQPRTRKGEVKQGTQPEEECLKRTTQIEGEEVRDAGWSANPVYSSRELENQELRTDRSELSLPWITMTSFTGPTVATNPNKPVSKRILESVKETTTKARVQIKAHPIRSPPRPVAATQTRCAPSPGRTQQLTPTAPQIETESMPPRVLSATDIAIQKTIERKLGRPLSQVDPASLKVISEERMKELMHKYGSGAQPPRTSVAAAILCNNKNQLRTPPDSPYSSADQMSPHRER